MNKKFSCYKCENRTAECHASCEKYAEEKRIRDERREKINKEKRTEWDFVGMRKDGRLKQLKAHRRSSDCKF